MNTRLVTTLGILTCIGVTHISAETYAARSQMSLPIIVPEVNLEKKKAKTLSFGFNNCSKGFYHTVIFMSARGWLVIATFNTRTLDDAKPKQTSFAMIESGKVHTRGVDGNLKLENKATKTGHVTWSVRGTIAIDDENYDPSSNTFSHGSFLEEIDIPDVPLSSKRPYMIKNLLANLRSIPQLQKATLNKICPE